MSEQADPPELLERPEVLAPDADADADADADVVEVDETIDHPAKVMRIGTMMKQLLEEVRSATLDEASRDRLREIYDTSITEVGSALSPDLRDELGRLALPFADGATPSGAELQIAQAQLVGWLEGLVQGMQAMLFAQQMTAQHQLQSMRGELGPAGASEPPRTDDRRPGTYL
ncbi:MAG: hypothetical protein ACI9MX_000490 [Candidatus Aldehydirespiratoraceae bacterium]|jgi:hypothetical protein